MSQRLRRLLAIVTVVAAAAAGGAIAAQAASSTKAVHACETSRDQLTLVNPKGRCAHGSHKVNINQQGPRGATGRPGAPGRVGKNGVGATSAVMDLTFSTNAQDSTKDVGTFAGYDVAIVCTAGLTSVALNPAGATKDLYVHGTLYSHSGQIEHYDGSGDTEYAAGQDPVLVDIPSSESTFDLEAYSLATGIADAPGQLLLMSGTSTATLDFYLYSSTTSNGAGTYTFHCQANAQLTPSTTQSG